jgi:hypothetical protein
MQLLQTEGSYVGMDGNCGTLPTAEDFGTTLGGMEVHR